MKYTNLGGGVQSKKLAHNDYDEESRLKSRQERLYLQCPFDKKAGLCGDEKSFGTNLRGGGVFWQ
jgi:hypothetical protein